jgi:RNA polymerase sigma factor (sigma-70 family)
MDEKNLLQIYKTCYPDVARYIMNRNGTPEQAEEAFHVALSSMLNQIEKGAVIGDFGAYLFRSSWNAFLAERKYSTRMEEYALHSSLGLHSESEGNDDLLSMQMAPKTAEPIEPGPGPEYQVHRQILVEAAESIIAELSVAQQNILNLSFDLEQNLDDEQIAQKLGLTTDYVRLARFRAMKALRERMYSRGFSSL